MIAFFPTLDWQEMFLLLVIGLLLYGRNLPDAGRSLGRIVAQLKRSFHDFKDQLDRDGELSDVKKTLHETAREVRNVAKVPLAISNPSTALRELTHQAMSSPLPEEEAEVAADVAQDAVCNAVDATHQPAVKNPDGSPIGSDPDRLPS